MLTHDYASLHTNHAHILDLDSFFHFGVLHVDRAFTHNIWAYLGVILPFNRTIVRSYTHIWLDLYTLSGLTLRFPFIHQIFTPNRTLTFTNLLRYGA